MIDQFRESLRQRLARLQDQRHQLHLILCRVRPLSELARETDRSIRRLDDKIQRVKEEIGRQG